MKLKETSFTFNVTTKGSATPDFTQDVGQSRFHYMSQDGFSDIAVALLYYKVDDIENIEVPLGKGGRRYNLYDLSEVQSECVIASVFNNIYVNGIKLNGERFIMYVLKDVNPSSPHCERRQLKFSRSAKYHNEPVNESCIAAITKALGCKNTGSWMVVGMDIAFEDSTEPMLYLSAVVVDENSKHDFPSVQVRSEFIHRNHVNHDEQGKGNAIPKRTLSECKSEAIQQIFYGAPGTGKSHIVKKKTEEWEKAGRVVRTTFHPDSDYSTFVGAYKPTMEYMPVRNSSGLLVKTNGSTTAVDDESKDLVRERQITYNFVPQAFLQAYVAAWADRNKPEYLVIEEINRGNCAQIFGDLFQLLDRGGNGFSEYPIKADKDLEAYLKEKFEKLDVVIEDYPNVQSGTELLLPDNLLIRATMNTSDQSLFPIDSAFKRRWDWQYVPIHNVPYEGYKIQVDNDKYDWWQFLAEINKRILDTTSSEDKQLGYFFCKAKEGIISAETFVSKVVFYIWNDVFKDYEYRNDAFEDDKDENGKERKLEFKNFYDVDSNGKTIVVTEKIRKFFDNLGLRPIIEKDFEDIDVEEETDESALPSIKDISKYSINGEGAYKKGTIAAEVMRRYVEDNPNLGVAEILINWKSFDNVFSNIAVSKEYFENFVSKSKDARAESRFIEVKVADNDVIYVSNQWDLTHLNLFRNKLAELGWSYTIDKTDE